MCAGVQVDDDHDDATARATNAESVANAIGDRGNPTLDCDEIGETAPRRVLSSDEIACGLDRYLSDRSSREAGFGYKRMVADLMRMRRR